MAGLGVSVVIPTYNRANLLPRAVRSALACVEDGDEILIADDGSTDATAQVLAPFGDRVRHVQLPHAGAGVTRNRGIAAATRPLIAFLDSDDEWLPDKLRLQRAVMHQRPDVLFCFSDFRVRTEQPLEEHPRYLREWHHDARTWEAILGPGMPFSSLAELPPQHADFRVHVGDLYLAEMQADYVGTFTLVARREEAGNALHFAEDVPTYEDWECFARLAGAGQAAFLDCETAIQWGHPGPRLTDANMYAAAHARLTILERVWGRDAAFLARHRSAYDTVYHRYHMQIVRWLLREGHVREARAELRRVKGKTPLGFRALAALPGPAARGAVAGRRLLRQGQRRLARTALFSLVSNAWDWCFDLKPSAGA